MKGFTWRLLFCAALAGCSFSSRSSEYFIVTYEQLSIAPSEQGKAALANAITAAQRRGPDWVAFRAEVPAEGGPAAELVRLRADAAIQAFAKAGIDPHILHSELRPVDAAVFREHQDTLDIQLGAGQPPSG